MTSPESLLLLSPPQAFSPDNDASPSSLDLKHQSEIKNNLEGKKNKWHIVKRPYSLENSFCTLLFEKSGQTSHLCLKQRSHPCWMFFFILEVGLSPSFCRNYIHTNELNAPGLAMWLEEQMVWRGACSQSQVHSSLPVRDGLTHTACL